MKNGMKTSLSIVIPAFNEEKRLSASLDKILSYLKERNITDYELVIVDNHSTDSTSEIIKKFCLKDKRIIYIRNKNKGKGYAIKRGVLSAKKRFILFSDADLSTPISELDKFLNISNDYDIIIGSRKKRIAQPLYRVIFGKVFYLLVIFLTGITFKDTQCGFKLFKSKVAKQIFKLQTLNHFSFDVELLYIAKNKYKIKEFPVVWVNSKESKVEMKDSIRMFFDILKVRFNDFRGLYNVKKRI